MPKSVPGDRETRAAVRVEMQTDPVTRRTMITLYDLPQPLATSLVALAEYVFPGAVDLELEQDKATRVARRRSLQLHARSQRGTLWLAVARHAPKKRSA